MKIIGNASEEDKLRTMECMYPQMRKIRQKVIKKDEALKKTGDALGSIMNDLVDLKTLQVDAQEKAVSYLSKQVKAMADFQSGKA